MNKYEEQVTEKVKAVYGFLTEKKIEQIKNGESIDAMCYAVSFDKKDELSILPIPLGSLQGIEERELLLREMGKILKKEKVKVKLFMIATEAWMSKIVQKEGEAPIRPSEDPNGIEVLILSGRDCYDNINYQMLKMKREKGKPIALEHMEESLEAWRKQEKKGDKLVVVDHFLDSIWTEYRKSK